MKKSTFKELADIMVNVYGVDSYQNNLNDDEDDEINDEVWFTCCECDEPVLFEDYGKEINIIDGDGGAYIICPICGEMIYLED